MKTELTPTMQKLLDDPAYAETIHKIWKPILEPILMEQQRMMSTGDDGDCPKQFKGYTVTFRCLERFEARGAEIIAEKKKQEQQS